MHPGTNSTRLALLIAVLLTGTLLAQPPTFDDKPLRGFIPSGSYAPSEIETINMQNGNLILNIPIVSLPPGRGGLTATLNANYNGKLYTGITSTNNCLSPAQTTETLQIDENGGSWTVGAAYSILETVKTQFYAQACPLTCGGADYFLYKTELIFPDGSSHVLVPNGQSDIVGHGVGYYPVAPDQSATCTGVANTLPPAISQTAPPISFHTEDGTYIRVDFTAALTNGQTDINQFTISFPDGRQVQQIKPAAGSSPTVNLEQHQFDRNGSVGNSNYIRVIDIIDPVTGTAEQIISDPLGRSIVNASNVDAPVSTVSAIGFGSTTPLTWTIHSAFITSTRPYNTSVKGLSASSQPLDVSVPVITEIDIPPPVSESYTFGYGQVSGNTPYSGQVRTLTTPSGATVNYTYFYDNAPTSPATAIPTAHNLIAEPIMSKTLNYEATPGTSSTTTLDGTWNYTISLTGNTSSVTAPDGGTTSEVYNNNGAVSTTLPDGTNIIRDWLDNSPNQLAQNPVPAFNISFVPASNTFVSNEYRTENGIRTVTSHTLDKDGNETNTVVYTFGQNGFTAGQPGFPTGTTPVVTTARTFTVVPSNTVSNLCISGSYCDPTVPRILDEVATEVTSGANTTAQSETA
jgi:hypothetical protein